MWKARSEPDTISYSAGASTCKKGQAKLEPIISSYSPAIRACEKRAAKLESATCSSYSPVNRECEKLEAEFELDTLSYNSAIGACKESKAKRSMAMWTVREAIADEWLRRGPERGEANEPDAISYNAGNSGEGKPDAVDHEPDRCPEGHRLDPARRGRKQKRCGVFRAVFARGQSMQYCSNCDWSLCEDCEWEARREPDTISYSAEATAYEKGPEDWNAFRQTRTASATIVDEWLSGPGS